MTQLGIEIMNANYQWKAANVASRLNTGAAVGYGGPLGWIIKKIAGKDVIKKLMDGPSYIATCLHHAEVLLTEEVDDDPFMADFLTIEE